MIDAATIAENAIGLFLEELERGGYGFGAGTGIVPHPNVIERAKAAAVIEVVEGVGDDLFTLAEVGQLIDCVAPQVGPEHREHAGLLRKLQRIYRPPSKEPMRAGATNGIRSGGRPPSLAEAPGSLDGEARPFLIGERVYVAGEPGVTAAVVRVLRDRGGEAVETTHGTARASFLRRDRRGRNLPVLPERPLTPDEQRALRASGPWL